MCMYCECVCIVCVYCVCVCLYCIKMADMFCLWSVSLYIYICMCMWPCVAFCVLVTVIMWTVCVCQKEIEGQEEIAH